MHTSIEVKRWRRFFDYWPTNINLAARLQLWLQNFAEQWSRTVDAEKVRT